MLRSKRPQSGTEVKVFDPRHPTTGTGGSELVDASVVRRGDQWWMYLAGQTEGHNPTNLYSASLPVGEPLAASAWTVSRDQEGKLLPLAGFDLSREWDSQGGRHCPSYVKGWDPAKGEWVERIYYAGSAKNLWGPYTIGFLEWNGSSWEDCPSPAFEANEEWEHGSVYEPNLIYHDGKWKIWYVAGSNQENYLAHGYAESESGSGNWSQHIVFAEPEFKMFDFCVRQRDVGFDAIFARVWLESGVPPPEIGLWWCRADKPGGRLADWSQPIQIMTADDRGWHSGPWKPSFQFDANASERALVFFDGLYRTSDSGPFPFAFTLGCVELVFR